jgi:hypothetical protein
MSMWANYLDRLRQDRSASPVKAPKKRTQVTRASNGGFPQPETL